jgi:phenylacetate-CoA ligase
VRRSQGGKETALERTPGVELYQIAQTAPDTLRVRLRTAEGAGAQQVRASVQADLTKLLAEHGLPNVTVEPTDEAPAQTSGGKYPHVIPYTPG